MKITIKEQQRKLHKVLKKYHLILEETRQRIEWLRTRYLVRTITKKEKKELGELIDVMNPLLKLWAEDMDKFTKERTKINIYLRD